MRKILLFCILAIAAMFLLGGCKPAAEEEAETPEMPEEQAEAEMPEEEAMEMPSEIFSDLTCVDGNLEVTVYNVGSDAMEVGKEITFIVNGLVTNPNFFVCEPGVELAPGESATCVISPIKPLQAENTVKISEKGAETAVELVVCSEGAEE